MSPCSARPGDPKVVQAHKNYLWYTTGHSLRLSDSAFLPQSVVTFRSLLSQIRLSSVTSVRPTQGVEIFGNISSPFCTLNILWPACKILRRSSQANPSIGGVKHKRSSKIKLCDVRVSHLCINIYILQRPTETFCSLLCLY